MVRVQFPTVRADRPREYIRRVGVWEKLPERACKRILTALREANERRTHREAPVEEHCEKIPDDIVRERLNQMILSSRIGLFADGMICLKTNIWTEMTEEASSRVVEGARRRVMATRWFLPGILVSKILETALRRCCPDLRSDLLGREALIKIYSTLNRYIIMRYLSRLQHYHPLFQGWFATKYCRKCIQLVRTCTFLSSQMTLEPRQSTFSSRW